MTKPEIYRSTVIGDETTKPIKVKELPSPELATFQRVQALHEIIVAAEKARDEIRNIRHCVVCGTNMGRL